MIDIKNSLLWSSFCSDNFRFDFDSEVRGDYQPLLSHFNSRFRELLRKADNEVAQGTFLDIGCGRGEMLRLFRDVEPTITAVGVDKDRSCVKLCEENKLNALWMDVMEFLGDTEKEFKAVTMIRVAEEMSKAYLFNLLKQLRGKINSNGVVIIETIDPCHPEFNGLYYASPYVVTAHSQQFMKFILQKAGYIDIQFSNHPDCPGYYTVTAMVKKYDVQI